MSTAATHPDPPQRSIQDEAESVRIAVRALGDMRNHALLHSPPHPPSVTCAYLSHVLRPHLFTPLLLQPLSLPLRSLLHPLQTPQRSPPQPWRRRTPIWTPRGRPWLPVYRPSLV